jgi:hypothetical protein
MKGDVKDRKMSEKERRKIFNQSASTLMNNWA